MKVCFSVPENGFHPNSQHSLLLSIEFQLQRLSLRKNPKSGQTLRQMKFLTPAIVIVKVKVKVEGVKRLLPHAAQTALPCTRI